MAQFIPSWAAQLAPSLAQDMDAAARARVDDKAREDAEAQGMGGAIGSGIGAMAAASQGLSPQAGAAVGGLVGGQVSRVASGKDPGFDSPQQGVKAATGALVAGSSLKKGYEQQGAAEDYNEFLTGLIEPGSEDRLTAYLAMPAGLAKKLESGDFRLFDTWYNSGMWQG
jgi:hypothetical protein